MIEIRAYVNANGISPFAKWRDQLDSATKVTVTVVVYRMEVGNFSAAKGVGAGVFEIRMDFGPGYRVYFGRDGDELVLLLGGGTKTRQQRDIEEAKTLWQEYKQRKGDR